MKIIRKVILVLVILIPTGVLLWWWLGLAAFDGAFEREYTRDEFVAHFRANEADFIWLYTFVTQHSEDKGGYCPEIILTVQEKMVLQGMLKKVHCRNVNWSLRCTRPVVWIGYDHGDPFWGYSGANAFEIYAEPVVAASLRDSCRYTEPVDSTGFGSRVTIDYIYRLGV